MNRILTKADLVCHETVDFIFGPKQTSSSDLTESSDKITQNVFFSWLQELQKEQEPYKSLSERCASIKTIQLDSGASLTCKIYEKGWESTAFGEKKTGQFRYIDLFEENETEKPLFRLRMSQDHQRGEWLWVNKGAKTSGKQVVVVAEKISRCMRIKKCFLADAATIKAKNGREMHIRMPLQIMRGYGLYGPLFTIANASHIVSNVLEFGSKKLLTYHQNAKQHQKDVEWMQKLKVSELKSIVKDEGRGLLQELAQSAHADDNTTFQAFLEALYKTKEISEDYEKAVFLLFDFPNIGYVTKMQKKYFSVLNKLNHNMLMSASFT